MRICKAPIKGEDNIKKKEKKKWLPWLITENSYQFMMFANLLVLHFATPCFLCMHYQVVTLFHQCFRLVTKSALKLLASKGTQTILHYEIYFNR